MQIKYIRNKVNSQVSIVSKYDIDEILTTEIGERYPAYRKEWYASMDGSVIPDHPLTVELETNNFCNFHCNMCIFSSKDLHPDKKTGKKKTFLDFSLFCKVINEGEVFELPALTYGFLSEPLLHPDIAKMVSYAREHRVIDQRLGSNGYLLSEKMSRDLIAAGLTRLEISVDAVTPETYNKVRAGGDFNTVLSNIHNFLKIREELGSRLPLLRVSFLKLNVNNHELDDFFEYWENYADYFSIQEPVDYGIENKGSELSFESVNVPDSFQCDEPFQRIFLRCDGTYLSCGHIHAWEKRTLGDAHHESLLDVWNSGTMKKLREIHQQKRIKTDKICFNCASMTHTA